VNLLPRLASLPCLSAVLLATLFAASTASAQKEFPPPGGGKARVVVVASGMSGPEHYETVAKEFTKLGYDVVLFDGNPMEGTNGVGVKDAITQALAMPHALPGKVALVGFSLGGGMVLFYGSQYSDRVAGVVAWYPANAFIKNIPGFVAHTKVPVLVFAGEKDHFRDSCCTADKSRALGDAAKAGGLDFQVFTYPGADHDFVKDGAHYKAEAYDDALAKTNAALKTYLGDPTVPGQ